MWKLTNDFVLLKSCIECIIDHIYRPAFAKGNERMRVIMKYAQSRVHLATITKSRMVSHHIKRIKLLSGYKLNES